MLEKIRGWYRALPDKKRYLEFVTALLTIPVLLTVIYTNLVRIKDEKTPEQISPSPTNTEKIIIVTQKEAVEKENSPTPQSTIALSPTIEAAACKKEVGPVKIASPKEEEVVQDNQICVNVDYSMGEYCSVAWSYKLDQNNWSDYTSGPFCFSNLTPGKHELDLRVQSTVSSDEITLERTFYYKTKDSPLSPTTIP